jgi:hypothetical protein
MPLPPEKRMFFSNFHLKNARFSATFHVFQPLPPEKHMFFSHFCPKIAPFSAFST